MTKQPAMRSPVLRRAWFAASMLLVAMASSGCQRSTEGTTDVTVIGEPPKIVDPSAGALTESQAVLLSSVAQGLVRFDASGQIVPGLAERWNVTDDGLSYIFRLQAMNWPDGRKLTAQHVARILRRQLGSRSNNSLKDTLGAIDQIVPMTDRVLEISLKAPRPHLLQLLAQPEFAIVREGQGTGPFRVTSGSKPDALDLVRTVASPDEEVTEQEEVVLGGRRSACCRASLPQRKNRPGAWRDVRRPALRPGERPSEECAPLRSGGRTVRASTRAR